jgi:superfamily II DNA/RNA helicase
MTEIESFRAHILGLEQDRGFQNEAAQVQAKALMTEIVRELPQYKWTYNITRLIRNVVAATFELEQIAKDDPGKINDLSEAARRFALVWEALAKLQESTTRETALLNAAVNYELAGYQANAACIAKQIQSNAYHFDERPSLVDMSTLFLQRRFIQLVAIAQKAQIQPQTNGHITLSVIQSMAVALAANAFSTAMGYFLGGDTKAFSKALEVFDNAEKLFASLHAVEESNLVRSIRSLLPVMQKRSTWTLLSSFAPTEPKWQRYLKLLARGVGPDIYGGRSVAELWPSQIHALQHGLLEDAAHKIIKMPTSAGKTRIAELAIIYALIKHSDAKCVYIAPYRALVSELEESFLNLFGDLGYRVSSVIGTFESDDFEELLLRDADIIVTTPEKLDLLFRTQPDFLSGVRLFVLDEAHIVHDPHRGAKYELLLTRLKRKLPSARFLMLSAVVPQQTLEDFAQWLHAQPQNDILSFTWRPSIQRYARFEWRSHTGVIRYLTEEDMHGFSEFVSGVIRHQMFEYINPKTGRVNRKKFPEVTNKAQIAAELALKFAELGPVLVFCTQPDFVKAVANALSDRLHLLALVKEPIPAYFTEETERRTAILAEEYLGEPFITWFKSGIGVHYGDLPDPIRHAVETDFRQRKLRVLVATNTLAQGVNLPVRTVIVHSCRRYDESSNRQVRIPARDYWNIAGRAGRAGEETEGLIIHISISDMDRSDVEYYFNRKDNVEPVQSALYQKLLALTQDRLTEEAFKAEIDPEILALLVEESEEELASTMRDTVQGSLVHIQAESSPQQTPMEQLEQLFVHTADELRARVPTEHRAVYSATGLSSTSCDTIVHHIQDDTQLVLDLLTSDGAESFDNLCEHLLLLCLSLSEIQPRRAFGGSYIDLLKQWVRGVDNRDLVAEFASGNGLAEDLVKFIDEVFRYKLPWGLSGYIRIAMKVLDIAPSKVPNRIKYLPSMVKFGLPDPTACWAMSAGVPTRRAAIEIGAAFNREYQFDAFEDSNPVDKAPLGSANTQNTFLEWLGTLDSERLRFDFGLTPPILNDVRRAIRISSRNPLLREFRDLASFLPRTMEVRGIVYNNRSIVALQARPGMPVSLLRDYDNPVDHNAIGVYLSNNQLGYIPSEIAHILAPEMDTGTQLRGMITNVVSGHTPKVFIEVIQEA